MTWYLVRPHYLYLTFKWIFYLFTIALGTSVDIAEGSGFWDEKWFSRACWTFSLLVSVTVKCRTFPLRMVSCSIQSFTMVPPLFLSNIMHYSSGRCHHCKRNIPICTPKIFGWTLLSMMKVAKAAGNHHLFPATPATCFPKQIGGATVSSMAATERLGEVCS